MFVGQRLTELWLEVLDAERPSTLCAVQPSWPPLSFLPRVRHDARSVRAEPESSYQGHCTGQYICQARAASYRHF